MNCCMKPVLKEESGDLYVAEQLYSDAIADSDGFCLA